MKTIFERRLLKSVTASCLEMGLNVTDEQYVDLINMEKILATYGANSGPVFIDTHNYKSEIEDTVKVRKLLEIDNTPDDIKADIAVEEFIDSTFTEEYKHYECLRLIAKKYFIGNESIYHICRNNFKRPIFKGVPSKRLRTARFQSHVIDMIIGELQANAENYKGTIPFDTKQELAIRRRIKEIENDIR